MANIKITDLPTATSLGDADVFEVVQGGTSKQISGDVILDAADTRGLNLFAVEGVHTPSTFTNNFSQAASPLKVVLSGYLGRAIYWKGQLDCSLVTFTPGSYIQAFRLPTNARPSVILHFPVFGLNDAIGVCSIHPDGYVYLKNVSGDLLDTGIIDFANVSYYKDSF